MSFLCDMTRENAAASHLLPMVLGRGSQKYPDLGAINRALEMIWDGTLDSGTGRIGETRAIGFSACYPDDRFLPGNDSIEDKTFDVFFDILFCPKTENGVFLKEYTESEKEKLIQRIMTLTNSKGKYADTRLRELMCENEPYGLPSAGTIAEIEAITPASLYAFYQMMICQFPVQIFYIGSTSAKTVIQKIKNRLQPLFHTKASLRETQILRRAETVRRFEETLPGKQGYLRLGFRTDCTLKEKEYPAFALMNEILGGCPISLLFTNVREKQSLCYYCYSTPNSLKGIMTIGAGIRDDNRDKTENAILAQVRSIQEGKFSDEVIKAALDNIESALQGIRDSRSTVENFLIRRLMAGADTDLLAYRTALRAVRKDDIVAAARKLTLDTVYYLKPDCSRLEQNENEEGEEDAI